jgi:hypothetical protein
MRLSRMRLYDSLFQPASAPVVQEMFMFVSLKLSGRQVLVISGLIAAASAALHAAGPAAQPADAATANRAHVVESYGKLPLSFEANRGQKDKSVKFLSRGSGYGLYLTSNEAVLALHKGGCGESQLSVGAGRVTSWSPPERLQPRNAPCADHTDVVRMRLAGANAGAVAPVGEEPLPGTANYFIGNDSAKWRTNVPTFAKVRYSGVYPGIDLIYYGNQRQLECDFIVAPGANPNSIRLRFAGATKLSLNSSGDLSVHARNGQIAFEKPEIWQESNGRRQIIRGRFTLLANHSVGFSLGKYDRAASLVIDPVLVYSTYLGGSALSQGGAYGDNAEGVAVDGAGNAYVTGQAYSFNFPVTKGAFQPTTHAVKGQIGATNAFVTKLNPSGTELLYSTYLGGSGGDGAAGVAVDASGNGYVTGFTSSLDFPVTKGAFQTRNNAADSYRVNAFLTKVNSAGTALVYSTYLGGSLHDVAAGIAVDAAGNVYITGTAESPDFPVTRGAFQSTNNAADIYQGNAFLTKMNSTGTALLYSTYLGGAGYMDEFGHVFGDGASGIAVDAAGHAYVTGYVHSTDFPVTKGAFQTTNHDPVNNGEYGPNAFVARLNPTGTALIYSTYLGGSFYDTGYGIAADGEGNAYVTGAAKSSDFPVTKGAFQIVNHAGGAGNAFVTKLNPTGTALIYSTYVGGSGGVVGLGAESGGDGASGIAVDNAGDSYVTGYARSTDFPVTEGAFQTSNQSGIASGSNSTNAFLTRLNSTGSALVYSTYLGGSAAWDGGDAAAGVALDGKGNAYLAGFTYSSDFPVTKGAFQTTNHAAVNEGYNAFVAKLDLEAAALIATKTALSASADPATAGTSVKFTAEVTAARGSAVPAGSVAFKVDEKTAVTETLSAGKAAYSTSSLAVGTHTVEASYAGSTSFAATSASLTEKIEEPVTSPPIFSPAEGKYDKAEPVTLTDKTKGAVIYFTTNGTTPTTASTKYTKPIEVSSTETIKAIAEAAGHLKSAVASATYTIERPAATPSISPPGGTYDDAQVVRITASTPGSTIHYTTNGTTPITASPVYTGPITVSASQTIRAIAEAPGYIKSAVATATYKIQ